MSIKRIPHTLSIVLTVLVLGTTLWSQRGVSFVNLLTNPEKYDGKKVTVSGVLHFQFEDSTLYFHKEDADYLTLENGVWINYAASPKLTPMCDKEFAAIGSKIDYFDGKYVSITGTFQMKEHGHLGAFAGSIVDVSDVFEKRRWFDGSKNVASSKDDGRTWNDCKQSRH